MDRRGGGRCVHRRAPAATRAAATEPAHAPADHYTRVYTCRRMSGWHGRTDSAGVMNSIYLTNTRAAIADGRVSF